MHILHFPLVVFSGIFITHNIIADLEKTNSTISLTLKIIFVFTAFLLKCYCSKVILVILPVPYLSYMITLLEHLFQYVFYLFQALLKKGQVSVELEVRPRYLVPDTNCFIDHLPKLQKILNMDVNSPYTIVVPLVGK